MSNSTGSQCWVSVGNVHTSSMVYRSFIMGSDGGILVFNSYGPEDDSSSTGAREYMLFPRKQFPTFTFETSQLNIILASGRQFIMDDNTGKTTHIEDADFFEDQAVTRNNAGGFEISSYKGIMIDFGFTIGRAPSGVPKGQAHIYDAHRNLCSVENKELFDYMNNGNTIFQFPTDSDFAKFLKTRCPQLDTDSLN